MSNIKFEQTLQSLNNELQNVTSEINAIGDKDDKENAKLKAKLMRKYKTVQSIISGFLQLQMLS